MAPTDQIVVRPFAVPDAPQLIELMRGLAKFEGYIEDFRVTQSELIRCGIGPDKKFLAFVAHASIDAKLLGMAVMYEQPWTYDMMPTLVLKELYVDCDARGRGIGNLLMKAIVRHARSCAASRIIWTVLNGNMRAEKFYQRLGGKPDRQWNNWIMLMGNKTATTRNEDKFDQIKKH